jgi:hypothetical protein
LGKKAMIQILKNMTWATESRVLQKSLPKTVVVVDQAGQATDQDITNALQQAFGFKPERYDGYDFANIGLSEKLWPVAIVRIS